MHLNGYTLNKTFPDKLHKKAKSNIHCFYQIWFDLIFLKNKIQ